LKKGLKPLRRWRDYPHNRLIGQALERFKGRLEVGGLDFQPMPWRRGPVDRPKAVATPALPPQLLNFSGAGPVSTQNHPPYGGYFNIRDGNKPSRVYKTAVSTGLRSRETFRPFAEGVNPLAEGDE